MKIIDFLIGIAVLFMGLLPFLTRVRAVSERIAVIGQPGSIVYQVVLIVIGVLTIIYSLSGKKRYYK